MDEQCAPIGGDNTSKCLAPAEGREGGGSFEVCEDIVGSVDTLTLTGGQVYVQTDVFDVEDGGALIKGPEDGEMGVMSMSAERVMVSDIRDTESYESEGGRVGMSTNGTPLSGSMAMGGGNAGYNQSSKDREDAVGSYLGQGQLSDDIASGKTRVVGDGTMAESVATTRETIKDESTGWGGGVTSGQLTDVGNVLTGDLNGLMSEGEIGQTVQDVGGLTQVPKAAGRVVDALSDVGNSVVTQLTTGIDAGEDYRNSTKFRQATLEFQAENPELAAVLNNKGEASSKDYQAAMQAYTDKLQDKMGSDAANAYLYDDAQIADKRLTGKNGVGKDGYGMADNTSKYPNAGRRKNGMGSFVVCG